MLTRVQLRKIARARIQDARVLGRSRRYDGAVYVCGYAVELTLKARICLVLKWPGFPETSKEFEGLQSFRIHNLDRLLHLTGVETKIKTQYMADWSTVATWDPEVRYKPIGSATATDANSMIQSAVNLMAAL
jgi:hypothetical protein